MGTFVTFVLITAPGDAALSGVGLQGRHLATLQKSETNGGVSCFLVGEPVCWFCPLVPGLTGPARRPRPGADGCTGRAPRGLCSPKSPVCSCLPPLNSLCSFTPPVCLPGKTFLCGTVKDDRFWVLSLACWHRELVWFVGFRADEVSSLPAEAGEHAAPDRAGGRGARPGLPAGHRRRTRRRDLSVKSSLK